MRSSSCTSASVSAKQSSRLERTSPRPYRSRPRSRRGRRAARAGRCSPAARRRPAPAPLRADEREGGGLAHRLDHGGRGGEAMRDAARPMALADPGGARGSTVRTGRPDRHCAPRRAGRARPPPSPAPSRASRHADARRSRRPRARSRCRPRPPPRNTASQGRSVWSRCPSPEAALHRSTWPRPDPRCGPDRRRSAGRPVRSHLRRSRHRPPPRWRDGAPSGGGAGKPAAARPRRSPAERQCRSAARGTGWWTSCGSFGSPLECACREGRGARLRFRGGGDVVGGGPDPVPPRETMTGEPSNRGGRAGQSWPCNSGQCRHNTLLGRRGCRYRSPPQLPAQPSCAGFSFLVRRHPVHPASERTDGLAIPAGLEPATYPLGGDCSIQLSHGTAEAR